MAGKTVLFEFILKICNILHELCLLHSSKGYGFVNFMDALTVSRVITDKNHVINGKIVICKKASPRKKTYQNIPKNVRNYL